MEDIEVFLFYETKNAIKIVSKLVDSPGKLSAIDRELKNFAMKIKQCPNWRLISKMGNNDARLGESGVAIGDSDVVDLSDNNPGYPSLDNRI